MRKSASRADRYGFAVVVVFASLLAVLLLTNLGKDSTDSALAVTGFADVGSAQAATTPVPTTAAVPVPEPTATPLPVAVIPAAAPVVEDGEIDDELPADGEAADDDSSSSDDSSDAEDTDTAGGTTQSANAAPAASGSTGGAAAAAPNPQAAATEVPNPQAAATEVPNPQPAASAVPNPQPSTQTGGVAAAPVSAPADAAPGGTFTHTLTANVQGQIPLFSSPGGAQFMPSFNGTSLPAVNPTVFGNALVYRVLAGAPGDTWAKVYVPARPNGTVAWVQTSQFNWGSSNRMLQINVSTNSVTVFEGTNVLLTTSAVTGKSSSPTPRAQGWVEEIMAGPSSAYGPRLISLGIFSEALNSFGGGVPKVALHGTNNPSLMGQYASNGCIRVPNAVISQIAGMIPVGSKVVIVG